MKRRDNPPPPRGVLTRGRGVRSGEGPGGEGAGCLPRSALQIAPPPSGLRRCLPAVVCLVFVPVIRVWMCKYICICTYKCVCIIRVCLGRINQAKGGSGGGERQTGIDSGYLLKAQKTPAEERAGGARGREVTLQPQPWPAEGPVVAAAPRGFPPLPAGCGRGMGAERLKSFPSFFSV